MLDKANPVRDFRLCDAMSKEFLCKLAFGEDLTPGRGGADENESENSEYFHVDKCLSVRHKETDVSRYKNGV